MEKWFLDRRFKNRRWRRRTGGVMGCRASAVVLVPLLLPPCFWCRRVVDVKKIIDQMHAKWDKLLESQYYK